MKRKLLMVIGSLFLVTTILSGIVAANELMPVYVVGKVTDVNNNTITGAHVIAVCEGFVLDGHTNELGDYVLDFTHTPCGLGSTVDVEVSYNEQTEIGSGTVGFWPMPGIAVAIINVVLPVISVPEFATAAIPVILALCSYLVIRRKE